MKHLVLIAYDVMKLEEQHS